ncbi:MAG TPA: 2OG-Fe dioxygenase family protein [Noviherbaspirillum sp.]
MPEIRQLSNSDVLGRSVWVGNCVEEVFLGDIDPAEIAHAASLWNHLQKDSYLSDGGSYRERRYAELIYNLDTDTLSNTGNRDFYQSENYNTVNGGTRRFELIEESFLSGRLLQTILRHFGRRFATALSVNRLELYLHQVRIIGRDGENGLPTPEGIHKDGVDYSCQVLFSRDNVSGGESIIYDNDKKPLVATTMRDPLDFYCFRDPDIYHSVTPIVPVQSSRPANRDILGIEFCINREKAK